MTKRFKVEYIGGPRDGTGGELDGLPAWLTLSQGRYLRSVRCADDGAMRYVWRASGAESLDMVISGEEIKVADWKLSPGDWCHIDVMSGDPTRARRFYGDVFGWTFNDYGEGMAYTDIKTSENGIESGIGGLAQVVGARPPASAGVIPYILAPDMDATLEAIVKAGGTVEIPRTDVFGYGDFAHFRDPDGNLIGLWRDASTQAGM